MSVTILNWQWALDLASAISGFEVEGLALFPGVIVVAEGAPKETTRHEMVHQDQMEEYGFLQFSLMYDYYYLKNRLYRGMSRGRAYRYNPFEIEAYRLQKKRKKRT